MMAIVHGSTIVIVQQMCCNDCRHPRYNQKPYSVQGVIKLMHNETNHA